MPTANAIPASEMTLIDRPNAAIATNEPITDTGMAMETISVGRHERRNSISSAAASKPPIRIFCCTRSMAESM